MVNLGFLKDGNELRERREGVGDDADDRERDAEGDDEDAVADEEGTVVAMAIAGEGEESGRERRVNKRIHRGRGQSIRWFPPPSGRENTRDTTFSLCSFLLFLGSSYV